MTALTVTHDKTGVVLSDGQTAWTLDRENARRLVAQLQLAASQLEAEVAEKVPLPPASPRRPGKVVAP